MVVAAMCLGCNRTHPPPVTAVPPAPPTPIARAEPEPEPSETERLREWVSPTLPGAAVHVLRSPVDEPEWALIAWQSLRIRVPYRRTSEEPSGSIDDALEAAAFLHELGAAGVVLSRTDRWLVTETGTAIECGPDEEADSPGHRCRAVSGSEVLPARGPAALAPPPWMLPPSRRARAMRARPTARRSEPPMAPPPEATRVADVSERHPFLRVLGVPLDASHRLLWVTTDEIADAPTGVLLCVTSSSAEAPALDCAPTGIDEVQGVLAAATDEWLVVAERALGDPRASSRRLVSLHRDEHGVIADDLDLGYVTGDGYACEDRPSYCVGVSGAAHRASLVAPRCVEVRPGGAWSATHVRAGDRWIGEVVEPDPRCVERYVIEPGRFRRGDCGPPAELPACVAPRASMPW